MKIQYIVGMLQGDRENQKIFQTAISNIIF